MPDPASPAQPDPAAATRGAALTAALTAVDALAELGEAIAEEWTYVTALVVAGRARIRAAAGGDLDGSLASDRAAAVEAACAESARMTDPHRAIDWLSTFPAVVELALGPAPGVAPPEAGPLDGRA